MKRILLALALVAAAVTSAAHAGESFTLKSTKDGVTLSHDHYGPSGPALVIQVPPDLSAAGAERLARWRAFCQPVTRTDSLGVEHYVYAHKGCDVGRDHE